MVQVGGRMLVLIVLVWVVSAVICYKLAAEKGHDPSLWALLGFFVGPLAILFIAIAQPRSLTENDLAASGDGKRCSNCAEWVRLEAQSCRYCHAQFDPEHTASLVAEREQAAEWQAMEEFEADQKHKGDLIKYGIGFVAVVALLMYLVIDFS